MLYSELDEGRWERRKIDIFPDGRWGYADEHEDVGGTGLGAAPTPSVEELHADPGVEAEEITRAELEKLWALRLRGAAGPGVRLLVKPGSPDPLLTAVEELSVEARATSA